LNTRPFEGTVLIVACLLALFWKLGIQSIQASLRLRVIGPAAAILVAAGSAMAYYNWRLTGKPFELPYALNQQRNALAPVMWFVPQGPTVTHRYRDAVTQRLWEWDAANYREARRNPLRVLGTFVTTFYVEFLDGPMLPLVGCTCIGFALAFKNRKLRVPAIICSIFALGTLTEKLIVAHYLAPGVPLLFLFTAAGIRLLSLARFEQQRLGHWIIIAALALSAGRFAAIELHTTDPLAGNPLKARFLAQHQLAKSPGRHVVFVRYGSRHKFNAEFVYNGPDIDAQKVIWAFDRGPDANLELQRYYRDCKLWLLEPDEYQPQLRPYDSR
jgi:hypothetical protein